MVLGKIKASHCQLEKFEIKLVPRALDTATDSLAKLVNSKVVDMDRSIMIGIMHIQTTEEIGKAVTVISAGK